MCRNIKRLRHPNHAPTDQELHDAALQFVRKISGFHAPSHANEAAFNMAVRDVALHAPKLQPGSLWHAPWASGFVGVRSGGAVRGRRRSTSTGHALLGFRFLDFPRGLGRRGTARHPHLHLIR